MKSLLAGLFAVVFSLFAPLDAHAEPIPPDAHAEGIAPESELLLPSPPKAAPVQQFRRARVTSALGVGAPLVAGAGAAAGLAAIRGPCEFCILLPFLYAAPIALAGPPLLAGGTMRQCHALKMAGEPTHCVPSWVTWGLIGAAVATVWKPAVAGALITTAWVSGIVAFVDVEVRFANSDLSYVDLPARRRLWDQVAVSPTFDRKGRAGVAVVGTF